MGEGKRRGDCLGKGGERPEMESLSGREDFLGEGSTQLKGGVEKTRESVRSWVLKENKVY